MIEVLLLRVGVHLEPDQHFPPRFHQASYDGELDAVSLGAGVALAGKQQANVAEPGGELVGREHLGRMSIDDAVEHQRRSLIAPRGIAYLQIELVLSQSRGREQQRQQHGDGEQSIRPSGHSVPQLAILARHSGQW